MDKKLRVFKLRNKTEEDLTKGLEGLKKELQGAGLNVFKQKSSMMNL